MQRIEILNPNDEVNLVNLSPGIYYIVYWDDNNVVNVHANAKNDLRDVISDPQRGVGAIVYVFV